MNGQHYSTINLKSSEMENGTWHLVFDVGFLSQQLKEVKVNANSGKITGYNDVEIEEDDDD